MMYTAPTSIVLQTTPIGLHLTLSDSPFPPDLTLEQMHQPGQCSTRLEAPSADLIQTTANMPVLSSRLQTAQCLPVQTAEQVTSPVQETAVHEDNICSTNPASKQTAMVVWQPPPPVRVHCTSAWTGHQNHHSVAASGAGCAVPVHSATASRQMPDTVVVEEVAFIHARKHDPRPAANQLVSLPLTAPAEQRPTPGLEQNPLISTSTASDILDGATAQAASIVCQESSLDARQAVPASSGAADETAACALAATLQHEVSDAAAATLPAVKATDSAPDTASNHQTGSVGVSGIPDTADQSPKSAASLQQQSLTPSPTEYANSLDAHGVVSMPAAVRECSCASDSHPSAAIMR